MPQVIPFKAITYNIKKVKNISRVVAPPYDIIPKKMQNELYKRDPHNIVRLILGKIKADDNAKDNRYSRAKGYFEKWLKNNVMAQDEKNVFYIYSQAYRDGEKCVERIGFIGLMKLDKGKRKIMAHENTLLAPKLDRLNLMRALRANLSPIFVLYEDAGHKIVNILRKFCAKHTPFIDVDYNGATHRVWKMDEARLVERIKATMRPKDIFIADGHHRYEVARTYSLEAQGLALPARVKRNSRFMMAYFVETDERMLTILPAHRAIKDIGALKPEEVLERLKTYFAFERASSLGEIMRKLDSLKSSHAFGVYLGKGRFYVIKLKSLSMPDKIIKNNSKDWKRLDVTILHLFILEYLLGIRDEDDNVEFTKDVAETVRLVDSGRYKIAFLLNPTKVSEVKRIARLGERMPRKATYFYPKPLSGLVINKF